MATKLATVEGITEYQLDNGFRFLLFPDPSSSKVTVNCTVFVGSRQEGYGETGMAHLLEHMLFKGTPKHPNIPKALRDKGAAGNFNGTTWVDRTNYYETLDGTDENLEFAVSLEADRLVNSYVKREDLVTEFVVVRNEFERGENDPRTILSQRMIAAAYEWHNYGKSTIGNRTDIERVPIDRLQAFYHKFYQPDNAMLIVAGKFDEAKAKDYIATYFGTLKKPTRELEATYTEEPPQDGERCVVLRRVGTVAATGAVYHIPAGAHEDFPAIEVLSMMLDAEPSGPLYQALVLTKKATKVSTTAYGWHDPGVFEVLVEVEKGVSPESVRDLMLDVLEKTAKEKITDEEVERAKRKLDKSRELQMTNSNRIAVTLSDWAAKGDWRLFFLHRDRVAKVTAADVKRVATKYLQRNNRTSGLYIPSEDPEKTDIPPTPDVNKLVADYKGGKSIAKGEEFDPTVANIVKRLKLSDLPSGIKVGLLPRKTRGESVSAYLTLHFGNADSLKDYTSATQFLGDMLERGTKKHTRQQLEDEIDRLKARLLISSGPGSLNVSIECKKENLAAVLALMNEVLREPTFPAEEFDVLKRQLRDGLEKQRLEPLPLARRALQRKLSPYPKDDVRYVPTVEESLERLEAVTLEQVRKLYQTQVGGQHGELVVVGDFDEEQVLKGVRDALKDWKAETPYRRIERPAATGIKGERILIETPDKKSAFYLAGESNAMTDADPDFPALVLADFIFGGGSLSSRLGDRVRQKEGSYQVGSQFHADSLDKSARFFIIASFNPTFLERIDKSMTEELDRMLKDGVSEKEVAEARAAFLGQMKQMRSTDAQLARMISDELFADRSFSYYGDLEKKIEALTPQEVSKAFRKHIDPAKLVIIRAGDFKVKSSSEK